MRSLVTPLALAVGVLLAPAAEPAGAAEPLTIVALGTSLTEGSDWPQRLGRTLSACWSRPVRVEVVAGSGMTSNWGLEQLGRVASLKPDIVLVEFAMNDANWRRFVTRKRSRANIVAIGRGIRDRVPGAKVFLMTTNVVHGLRGIMRPTVDAHYGQYREIAAAEGLRLIDLAPKWAVLPRDSLRRAVPDGVHPTPEAFARIAAPEIVSALSEGQCR
jgi:lysophospholipase L1-like esterase